MQGTLIVNFSLNGDKYTHQNELYRHAADELGISLSVCTNADLIPEQSDFVLFLDKDILLARSLELAGFPVFNSSRAIALCDDKALTYLALQDSGLSMPKTMLLPMSFFKTDWTDHPFIRRAAKMLGFPIVVKESCGSFGGQVWLAGNEQQLTERLNQSSPKRVILQEFIASSYGRDVRINIVGGKPVASMYRYSDTDFRANISAGGKMKPYDPTAEQITLAVRACELLKLDFGGVDILFGKENEPILCEVNSNAHIKNIFDCTGINVAKSILEHIADRLENGK